MKEIIYLKGDATSPQVKGYKVIAHICNNRGSWGAGFVMAISKKWSSPEIEYRKWIETKTATLGEIQLVPVEDEIVIANMIAQDGFVNFLNPVAVRYEALKEIYSTYVGYLVPVIYALFITIFLDPVATKIEEKTKLSRLKSVCLTFLLVVILVVSFIGLVLPELGKSFKELYSKFPMMQDKIGSTITQCIEYLKEKNILVIGEKQLENNIIALFKKNIGKIQEYSFTVVMNIMWWLVALGKFFIGFFLAFFILIDKRYFINFKDNILKICFGNERGKEYSEFLNSSRQVLLNYVWGRMITSGIVGAVTFGVLLICNVPYALLSGIMIGIGNMIPYIGSFIAGVIAVFLVVLAEPMKVFYLFLAMIIAQTVDGWVIGPKIVSETVGMSTFWVVVAVLIGGSLMGPVGMFFGVPAFGIIKLIYLAKLKKAEEKSNKFEGE